jgi:AAA+ ATPase superfamily predicted ATPase
MRAIEGALNGSPSFTVLFGASSVGKTALLREVLSREKYHVLFFDLRIAGFADLRSLYFSLVGQMEQYFERLKTQPGWKEWEKEAWSFKHDRLDVERRLMVANGFVEPADIARVMELFQVSFFLQY